MLQSMGSQRFGHNLATEQQHTIWGLGYFVQKSNRGMSSFSLFSNVCVRLLLFFPL